MVLREEHARQWRGMGYRGLARSEADVPAHRRRREQRDPGAQRDDGTVVGQFGRSGRNAGQFHWIHAMAVDAKGNVYTAEVDNAKRIQKFKLTSDALR
jgi:hypothetical protein